MARYDRKLYVGLFMVLALSFASYAGTISSPFHFDDLHSIVLNPNIRSLGNVPRYFISAGADSSFIKGGYRPVVTASLALNHAISGDDPWSYHLLNVIFHLAAVLAVFVLARHFLAREGLSPYYALLAAAVFGFNPVQTSAVSYVIARSAVICTSFYVSSFYAYVRYREGGGARWASASFCLFLAALLTKEIAITLPVVILLYELGVRDGRHMKGYAPLAVFALADLAFVAVKYYLARNTGYTDVMHPEYFLLAKPCIVVEYLRLFALPVNLAFYRCAPSVWSLSDAHFVVPAAVVALAVAAIAGLFRKKGLYALFSAWFFVALLPETLTGIDPMVEYRLYLPSVGLAVLLSLAAAAAFRNAPLGRPAVAAVLLVLAFFFVLTAERNALYKDDVALWRDAARKNPGQAVPLVFLGGAYMGAMRYGEASEVLSRALAIDPFFKGRAIACTNLGLSLEKTGRYGEAMDAYRSGLSAEPGNRELQGCLGRLSRAMDRAAKTRAGN